MCKWRSEVLVDMLEYCILIQCHGDTIHCATNRSGTVVGLCGRLLRQLNVTGIRGKMLPAEPEDF